MDAVAIELDAEAIFWTLSTVAQALVGLVALVSFIAIWRLQGIDLTRQECRASLLKVRADPEQLESEYGLPDDQLIAWAEELSNDERDGQSSEIDSRRRVNLDRNVGTLKFLNRNKTRICTGLPPVSVSGLATTVGAMVALPFTHGLVEYPVVGVIVVAAVLIGVAATTWFAYQLLTVLFAAAQWFDEPPPEPKSPADAEREQPERKHRHHAAS